MPSGDAILLDPNKPTIVLFHWRECGWCKAMLPAWKEARKKLLANNEAIVQEFEREASPKMMETYAIKSYPTILRFDPSGTKEVHKGARDVASLIEFATKKGSAGPDGVTLIYWKDCGYCKAMKPEWEKAKKELLKMNVPVQEYERDENPEEIAKFEIEGFPTLLFSDQGRVSKFMEERTSKKIVQWVKRELKNHHP